MTVYEFTGKSVKEAVAKACEELKTEESLLEIEVLEQSARGFLGLVGQRDAKIRVRKRDILQEVIDVEQTESQSQEIVNDDSEVDDLWPIAEQDESEVRTPSESKVNPELLQAKIGSAADALKKILELITVEAEVQSRIDSDSIYLNIIGDGSGLLIGKKGQTLDALQFMVNKIVNRENGPGEKVDVVVDTENYRIRKKENLKEIAVKMSQKAKRTLKPVSFNPMPPHERRIIHLILSEDKEVYTKSYGEGPMRRIIVYPRRGSSNRRRRR